MLVFFAMILIGFYADQPTETIAMRSMIGAFFGYVATYLALKLAVIVMADAVKYFEPDLQVSQVADNETINEESQNLITDRSDSGMSDE